MRSRIPLITVSGVLLAGILFWAFYGGSPHLVQSPKRFDVIAHRGLHVNWEKGVYDRVTGCEAVHIYQPAHNVIENTIESIGAAFDLGATIVEIDIRHTADDHLVVFHDWMLECRTDGTGEISEHTLETCDYMRSQVPSLRRLLANRPLVKRCFVPYVASLGFAGFPEACRGEGLGLPSNYLPLAWGWPYRFLSRAEAAGVRFYVLVDTEEDLARIAGLPIDGIVTDYIDIIGPLTRTD